MALQAGKIQIDFTCNYPTHRVAWQLSTDPPGSYTIVEPASPACAGGGVASSVYIDVMLDHNTCDTLTFQGYIQPTCEALGSLVGQVAWSCDFVPDEDCYSAEVECIEVEVDSIEITDRGTGYNVPPGAAPTAIFSGGAATAVAYVADDSVATLTISNQGVGADPGDGVYTGITQTATTGAGAGAIFEVTLLANVVTNVRIDPSPDLHTNSGNGYVGADAEELTLNTVGGTRTGIKVTVTTIYDAGLLLEVLVTGNDYYAVAPTIVIGTPPAGDPPDTTATADVIMLPCDPVTPVLCDGNPASEDVQLELNQTTVVCGEHTAWTGGGNAFPPFTADGHYSQSHAGCCYNCIDYGFTLNSGSDPTITYLDCETGDWIVVTLSTTFQKCIVEDAYFITPATADVTVSTGAAC